MASKRINPDRFITRSLNTSQQGVRVTRIMASALDAVDPYRALKRCLNREGTFVTIGDKVYNLDDFERVVMVGFGKASKSMGEAAVSIFGKYLKESLLITKGLVPDSKSHISFLEGGHPVPDHRSLMAAQKITNLLSTTTKKDLVICLISGGGSSLLTSPISGVSLDDIQLLTKALLGCGATINEINCLRKHISRVKGGQLAQLAYPAKIVSLILSDVVGDSLDVIASGPTVPDTSTYSDALSILNKYGIFNEIPESILKHLKRGEIGEIKETPKTGDSIFENVQNIIIGNNYLAAKAAIKQAKAEGYNTLLLTTSMQGEARIAGRTLAAIAKQVASTGEPIKRPACIVAGGETTVTLRGNGRGGRNQELALGTVKDLSGIKNVVLITLATDGDDGPTDAAGAVVTGDTMVQADAHGLNPTDFLSRNNSYEFFDRLGDLLKPGMTGTNVNDLTFLIIY